MVRLMHEKDNAENTIASLQQEIQILSRMHEQYRERTETEARQMEEHLTSRIKEAEFLLMQSKKKAEEIESASQLRSQLWSRKANIFQSFMDNQQMSIKVVLFLYQVSFVFSLFMFLTYIIQLGYKVIVSVH
jgi:kinesin family member C2/C3